MGRWERKPRVPKGGKPWPDRHIPTIDELVRMYENGFLGTIYDEGAREELFGSVQYPDGDQAAYDFGLVGSGAGKLSIPFIYSLKQWPNAIPSPNQTTGDCVSHAGKNCGLFTIGVDVATALPDPVTGKMEGFPEVSALAEKNGVVASEPIYGARGHSGQGANCDRLIKYATSEGGIMLRKNYPEIGINLEEYNASIGIKWGSSGTPADVSAVGKQHQLRTATDAPNHEVVRDFVANGYIAWICSSLGFSKSRDENGFSKQQGSWGHSWVIGGYDDRPEFIQKYGCPGAWFCHDWFKWNSGGRRILGTDIDIPEGTMWIDATLLDRCDVTMMSSLDGWPRRDLPNWNLGI